jgi:hypothetical protein
MPVAIEDDDGVGHAVERFDEVRGGDLRHDPFPIPPVQ